MPGRGGVRRGPINTMHSERHRKMPGRANCFSNVHANLTALLFPSFPLKPWRLASFLHTFHWRYLQGVIITNADGDNSGQLSGQS